MTRWQTTWIALALLAVVAGIVGVVAQRDGQDGQDTATESPAAMTTPTTTVTAESVSQFKGTGDTETPQFRVATNWEIRWSAPTDSGFVVELLTASGGSRGKIISGEETASGSTYVSEAGEFKLRVTSRQPWSMEIFSRPAEK